MASIHFIVLYPQQEVKVETKKPYRFGYEIQDKDGNLQHRHEQSDSNGVRRGSYGYLDANGIYRTVEYIADEHGFRVNLKSNEPGLDNRKSADVNVVKQSIPLKIEANKIEETLTPHKTESYVSKLRQVPSTKTYLPVVEYKTDPTTTRAPYDFVIGNVDKSYETRKPYVGNAYSSSAHLRNREDRLNEVSTGSNGLRNGYFKPPYDLSYKSGLSIEREKSSQEPYRIGSPEVKQEMRYKPKRTYKFTYILPPRVYYDDSNTSPEHYHAYLSGTSKKKDESQNDVHFYGDRMNLKAPRYHSLYSTSPSKALKQQFVYKDPNAQRFTGYNQSSSDDYKRELRDLVPYFDRSDQVPYQRASVPEQYHTNIASPKVSLLFIDPKYAKYSDLEGLAAKSYAFKAPMYKD